MAACSQCGGSATHRCAVTGSQLCWAHARVAVVSGEPEAGFAGILVRDEFRLVKSL
jgi:hypothetical protein